MAILGRDVMKKFIILIILFLFESVSIAGIKIRDMATIEGVRDNQLIGYGLVVGLNGTGDKSGTEFTIQSLVNMLDRMGITVDKAKVKVKNVAAVMVTAKLSPFAAAGSKLDVPKALKVGHFFLLHCQLLTDRFML
jgi:flagellar P-ring protein precursor FlgI